MPRHSVYLSDQTEQLLVELGLTKQGWSSLVNDALVSHVATLPPAKVQRAARKVGRQAGAAVVEQLTPPTDA